MQRSLTRRVAVRGIDTNIIVRFLVGDDPGQAAKARQIIADGAIFVATSVLLETEWVLRSSYGLTAVDIVNALRNFLGLPGVTPEDAPLAAQALDWAERGMDFADALHLARAENCSAFVSFDRRLAKVAPALSPISILLP